MSVVHSGEGSHSAPSFVTGQDWGIDRVTDPTMFETSAQIRTAAKASTS
ncbi:MAG: hypothetical protein JHD12_05290 [Rhodococcus sp.]|nr:MULTISPECIES: hypothetical protein [Rhodococcus]MBJ7349991.1 hypothetical protein [Rhodococcus sp. (in: high G+C Gram-positive bacteria)]MBW4781701.1 hypothetical protein [Rhodococcus fascians]MCC8930525.1 hypothetical protein [Rhodococcus sp. I2R]WQH28063.1 hypothetical protein U2G91_23955 [Rhodococcus fascians]